MPSRLPQAPSPSDTEARSLQLLTAAIVPGLDSDVQTPLQGVATDGPAIAETKWRRAVTESVAKLQQTEAGEYVWVQDVPAATWTIPHFLGAHPAVTATTAIGQKCYGDVVYLDENTLTITFAGAESGKAFLR